MVTMAALVLGATAAPALAEGPGNGNDKSRSRISEAYDDMGEFEWGLNDVTKLYAKGIFKGRGDGLFAPGAKITQQETAVALVRLLDLEADAAAMTEAQVKAQLQAISDRDKIADWARNAVAALVKAGVVEKNRALNPTSDATRTDIAVLLVRAVGLEAEARAKADAKLNFKDANQIPSAYVGHVAVAVDYRLINGYDDRTFRPNQAVKRIEMAVMMGRADRLIERERQDEYKGTVKSVDARAGTFVLRSGDEDISLRLADEASVFVDNRELSLANLKPGMLVEVKLNRSGEVVFVEAKSPEQAPAEETVSGTITGLRNATSTSLALVNIDGTLYPVSPRAVLKLDGQIATFADLRQGDAVRATVYFGLVLKLEATRAPEAANYSGMIADLKAATSTSPAKLTLAFPSFTDPPATQEFTLSRSVSIKVNGVTAQFSALREGDSARITVSNGQVTKVEVQRSTTTVSGDIAYLSPATKTEPAMMALSTEGFTTEILYHLTPSAVVLLNGQAAKFADLRVGDHVTLHVSGVQVEKVEAVRSNQTVIEGSVTGLAAPAAGATSAGRLSVGYTQNGSFTMVNYDVPKTATITLNGRTADFVDLKLNDSVKVTLVSGAVTKVAATR
jgi:hypothetical protein